MKLQKLVYFAHGWHLALDPNGKPLVRERPQAWDFGPVFPSLYQEFKDYGNRPIDRPAFTTVYEGGELKLVSPTIDAEADKFGGGTMLPKAVMDHVFKVYGSLSAARLSEMTHVDGSPWSEVRKAAKEKFQGRIPRGLEIPDEVIRKWFQERLATMKAG